MFEGDAADGQSEEPVGEQQTSPGQSARAGAGAEDPGAIGPGPSTHPGDVGGGNHRPAHGQQGEGRPARLPGE